MSEVVVTRADREAAIGALGYHPTPHAPQWIETGIGSFCGTYDEVDHIAIAIARARAEGEAAGRYEERRAIYAKASQMAMACDQGETPHGLDGAEAIRDLQDWMIKRGKCYEGTGEERGDGTP